MPTPNKQMLISSTPNEIRIAITSRNKLIDLDFERADSKAQQKKSNIYKGRISSIEPSLAAVFVDYGCERHGFLPLKEISSEYFITNDPELVKANDMKKLLKLGQEVVVQVEKEERGNKGAALTTFISLAGSYVVLMPNNPRAGGISRRVEAAEREHLQALITELKLPQSMGMIVRTAGVGRSKQELSWDLDVLLSYWEAIKNAAVQKPAPYLIHQESGLVTRVIRDYLREDVSEVIIDNEHVYTQARDYVNLIKPAYLPRIKQYQESLPLFNHYQIEKQIELAYLRELRLPSGGSIVIDHTEALVAIDINSARATKGSDIEETALNTNLEAADEIARQIRLRDIGGLVVIDFIDMSPAKNQREVENRLRDALRYDRARIQVGKISRFGLLEMSRQRLASSLSHSHMTTCAQCHGQGLVRSVESLAMSILHKVQEQIAKNNNLRFELQLPTNVATYMLNEKRSLIIQLERMCQNQITVVPNPYLTVPDYQIKTSRGDRQTTSTQSHQATKKPKQDSSLTAYQKGRSTKYKTEQPMVDKAMLHKMRPAPRQKGWLARLLDWLSNGGSNSTNAKPSSHRAKTRRNTNQGKQQAQRRYQHKRPRNRPSGQGQNRRPSTQGQNRPARQRPDAKKQNPGIRAESKLDK